MFHCFGTCRLASEKVMDLVSSATELECNQQYLEWIICKLIYIGTNKLIVVTAASPKI